MVSGGIRVRARLFVNNNLNEACDTLRGINSSYDFDDNCDVPVERKLAKTIVVRRNPFRVRGIIRSQAQVREP